jgi:diguanylate cyclase (GGDEF)-like protein
MNMTAMSDCPEIYSDRDKDKAEIRRLKARITELERLVGTDTLTPLFNRRYFMQTLERWCWRAHRYGGKAALLYVDVDNLKTVNDRCGHQAGDSLLVAIADSLLALVRKSDIVSRIGGDEFVVLMECIDTDMLPEKVLAIKNKVAAMPPISGAPDLRPSVSIGFISIQAGDRPEAVLRAADKAMYADKMSEK